MANALAEHIEMGEDIQDSGDRLGGFTPFETDVYPLTIKVAYLDKSAGGANSVVINAESEDGRQLRQTLWVTSGEAKGCKNFYVNQKGEKHYLPGFKHANDLSLLAAGKNLQDLATEKKWVKKYSPEAGQEVDTEVDMLVQLLEKPIIAAVFKKVVDKRKRNPDNGKYEATGETRIENEIDKFFRVKDNATTTEIIGKKPAEFMDKWKERNAGQVKDESTKGAGGSNDSGVPDQGAVDNATAQSTAALFT